MQKRIYNKSDKKNTPSSFLRRMVSKKKNRYNFDGTNLDLTYITESIIAMGFPSSSAERLWRNPRDEVKRFLGKKHRNHYKLYNLCIEKERQYKNTEFNQVECYGFYDHHAPDFELILEFCADVESYLNQDSKNVAVIHCKAGKGRTGVMISCYLLYSKMFKTAKDSLLYYGLIRTKNGKGVTIPSQIRYVYYFEHYIKSGFRLERLKNRIYKINKVTIGPKPDLGVMKNFGEFSNLKFKN